MPAFVGGVGVLGLLLILARGYVRTSARTLASGMRFSGGVILALLTLALAMSGRLAFAFLTAGAAWYLLFGSPPPWQDPYSAYRGAGGPQGNRQTGTGSPPRTNSMSRAEALKGLGLEEGATEEQIRSTHRRLIQQTPPDTGGTNYLP